MSRYRIERLRADHDLKTFSCGDAERDAHLAACQARAPSSWTFVAVRRGGGPVVGFYTLGTGLVGFRRMPRRVRQRHADGCRAERSPQDTTRVPVPVARLTHLGVDESARSVALRVVLVVDALKRVGRAGAASSVRALVVRAWSRRTGWMLERFGFRGLRAKRRRYVLSVRTLRTLVQSTGSGR